jgi:hypothetical protein
MLIVSDTAVKPLRCAGCLAPALALLLAGGCGRDEVRTYRVPKERPPALPAIAAHAHAASPGQIAWTAPAGWAEQPAGGMRAGSFKIAGQNGQTAEVAIIPLSTWSGMELDNVNRWRAQVGQQPITAEDLPKHTAQVPIGELPGQLFEMSGVTPEAEQKVRILAAVLPLPAMAWFFKIAGDDTLVLEQKSAFTHFLKSVKFAAAAEASGAPPPEPAAPAHPEWKVPSGWEQQPPKAMQMARFKTPGEAEVTVTSLPGDGGGDLANVNRWRKQLGLGSIDQAGLGQLAAALDLGGSSAMLVDMTGEDQRTRMIAAILARSGSTLYYKLTGPTAAVGAQKQALVELIKSTR